MLLVAFESDFEDQNKVNLTNPKKIDYKEGLDCLLARSNLYRKHYMQCYNEENVNVRQAGK